MFLYFFNFRKCLNPHVQTLERSEQEKNTNNHIAVIKSDNEITFLWLRKKKVLHKFEHWQEIQT